MKQNGKEDPGGPSRQKQELALLWGASLKWSGEAKGMNGQRGAHQAHSCDEGLKCAREQRATIRATQQDSDNCRTPKLNETEPNSAWLLPRAEQSALSSGVTIINMSQGKDSVDHFTDWYCL